MKKYYRILLGFPKTLYLNFRSFPFKQAIKLPVVVAPNVIFVSLKGHMRIDGEVRFGMIQIGFNGAGTARHIPTSIENEGTIVFSGPFSIGGGYTVMYTCNWNTYLWRLFRYFIRIPYCVCK